MAYSSRASSLTPCPSPSPEPPVVQPDHFYGSEGIQLPPSPNSDGKTWLDPDDDPTASRGIPVFKPTMEEFEDFEAYMDKINCWGLKSGIVKVIPPKEWSESLPDIKPQLREVKIRSPIEQVMLGSGGLFRQQNMEKRRIMSVREWAELCSKDEYRAPAKQDIGLQSRAERMAIPRGSRRTARKKESVPPEAKSDKNYTEASRLSSVPSPPPSEAGDTPASGSAKREQSVDKSQPKPKGKRVAQTREARQANLAERALRDNEFIDTFDPHTDWLPPNTTADDYTPEYCQKLERHYWRNCGLGKSAWYGADTQGTLYTDETKVWNVGRLPSALSRLLPASDQGLPGVNTPYLYFGMWRATFAWHVEDMDLYSINYIHFGAPKFWYAVPQARANTLEHAMRNYFPKDTSQCPQFLRHKSFLASPTLLAKSSCRPNHLVQHAGEFVITYPRGYHAGFNLGFNCAESVNFALECWIEMGRVAKACKCVSDSVRIDVDQLLQDRAEEAMKAVAQMEMEMEQNGGELFQMPKPKRKRKERSGFSPVKEETCDGVIPTLKIPLKRKPEEVVESPKTKKIKIKPTTTTVSQLSPSKVANGVASTSKSATSTGPSSQPKISVKLKLGPKPAEPEEFPCCLCISTDRTGLLRVQGPPLNRKDAIEAAGNPKVWMAHEHCASIIPETWVDETALPDGSTEKVVLGIDAIVKDRWNLKCSACTRTRPKVHGAPVQCTKGKCPKAFHVSCAREGSAHGIIFSVLKEVEKEVVLFETNPSNAFPVPMQVDGATSSFGEDEGRVLKVVKKLVCEILCPQHNPALAAQKKASKQEKIKAELLLLPSMSRIKIRVSSGVFEVSLIRVIEETGSVEVLWDRGITREFKWGSVIFGSTDGPVLQRPVDDNPSPPVKDERSVSVAAPSTSAPVQTYPSTTAATTTSSAAASRVGTPSVGNGGAASEPSTSNPPAAVVTQPTTSSQYPFGSQVVPTSATPYWSVYAPQQIPYGHPQLTAGSSAYPYTGYYRDAYGVPQPNYPPTQTYHRPAAYNVGGYHGTGVQDSRLQWQRPYEGPGSQQQQRAQHQQSHYRQPVAVFHIPVAPNPNSQTGSNVTPAPSSSASQTSSSDLPSSSSSGHSNGSPQQGVTTATQVQTSEQTQVGATTVAQSSTSGPSTSSGCQSSVQDGQSSQSGKSPSDQPSGAHSQTTQQGYPDLSTLAKLPPEELTEMLQNNPDLRNYIMSTLKMSAPVDGQVAA
ncbi:specific transcriptional repressor [Coprinopsis cinerea okayama7|uniref:[histone H3]-trimethyl-L-lysine(9) demethylase n=1 Tax=Coprinopsis cinerea (strain Okayama-7 / 130 / ATCC MYA-4618 / FGSC 9003) TaxID=240176 RepID=A8P2R1_COPC7|nr:specific transcriptional repressor [Coprinopsis cinerea okayama7\|eukprot:XP_001838385.2 specific transcriptional repressor [Coprinopsis cinerea okayama7\